MRVLFIFSIFLLVLFLPQPSPTDPTVNRLLDFGAEVLRQTNQPDYSRQPSPQQQPRYRDRSWQDERHYTTPPQPSYLEPHAPPPAYTGEDVAKIQRLLTDLGYEPGPIDGLMGSRTRTAIKAWQRHAGMPETGQPTRDLRVQLERAFGPIGASETKSRFLHFGGVLLAGAMDRENLARSMVTGKKHET